jgi:pilus assembly protein Flp/PilA
MFSRAEYLARFWRDQSGASAAEYAIMLAVISAVMIGGAIALGTAINGELNCTATTITNATSACANVAGP